jgi:hypothetical protein
MKAATVHELKSELNHQQTKQLVELCIRLAKYKKENKELLDYLLFEAHDEKQYVRNVQAEIDSLYEEIPKGQNLYYVKKSVRKILRIANKYVRYSGNKTSELELRIYFCSKLKESGIPFHKSTALNNLYLQQLKKIKTVLNGLHEDLQYDYSRQLEELS